MTASNLEKNSKRLPPARLDPENTPGNSRFTRRHKPHEVREQPTLVTFTYQDEPYEAIYNKGAITVQFGRAQAEAEKADDASHLVAQLSALLLDWDLVQEDGETPLPVSAEELEVQPVQYLIALVKAIWEDYNGGLPPTPSETP